MRNHAARFLPVVRDGYSCPVEDRLSKEDSVVAIGYEYEEAPSPWDGT